jgi:hypothetical protein
MPVKKRNIIHSFSLLFTKGNSESIKQATPSGSNLSQQDIKLLCLVWIL